MGGGCKVMVPLVIILNRAEAAAARRPSTSVASVAHACACAQGQAAFFGKSQTRTFLYS